MMHYYIFFFAFLDPAKTGLISVNHLQDCMELPMNASAAEIDEIMNDFGEGNQVNYIKLHEHMINRKPDTDSSDDNNADDYSDDGDHVHR